MYKEIAANKRKTWFLVALVSALLIALLWTIGRAYGLDSTTSIVVGTLIASVYSLFSYYFSDKIALATSGAQQITKAQAPELYTVVENLCIASGQPMPKIYVINEEGPNAFATGRNPEHASIAFTTGILALLTKTELEGVAAHELSHVKNYDILVMTIVVVLIGAIMLVADIFLRMQLFGGRRSDREGNAGMIFFVIGLVLAILSPLIAQLIKFAVSRSREYLADSSGALLTRHPEGLASALEKLRTYSKPLRHANHAMAHMYISNPFGAEGRARSFLSGLLSTHPPIEERIKRLRSMGN